MDYTREGVRVGPASCGVGVFALKHFRGHELLGPIRGTVMDDPQYESEYCMEAGDGLAFEPAAPFRYLNHSCRPNCALVQLGPADDDASPGRTQLWLETLTEIVPGAQMTIDYGWPAENAVPCRCGSPECRGWIVAAKK